MAARAMSFDSDSTPERWHLGRKLTLLFLLVIALALGLVILFHQRTTLPLFVFNLFADMSIGLVVGLATRFVLRQRNWFIRGLSTCCVHCDWITDIRLLHGRENRYHAVTDSIRFKWIG